MKRNIVLMVGLVLAGFLAACGDESSASSLNVVAVEEEANETVVVVEQTAVFQTVVDKQGAVSVTVTPSDLRLVSSTLVFEVTMDTHSVDLNMDLAELATVTTDNGHAVSATLWDAIPGGHHLSGELVFPAVVAGTAVLEGATTVTLTITGVDAPSRVFTWSLNP